MSGIPKLEFTKIGVLWLARYREYNLRIDAPAPWNNRRYGISIYKPNPTLVRLHWQGDFKSLEAAQQYGQEWLEAYLAGLAS